VAINIIGNDSKNVRQRFQPVAGGVKTEGGSDTSNKPTVARDEPTVDSAAVGNSGDVTPETPTSVNPGTISSNSASGDAPFGFTKSGRVRNRPVGSARRNDSPEVSSKTSKSLVNLVYMLHGVVSNIVKVPALKISLEASRELTNAALEVAELYDVPLPSEKVAALMNLGSVAYSVYIVGDKPKISIDGRIEKQEVSGPMPSFMQGAVN
jgi:hypothetical protein